jgi:hypothetical protein
MDAATPVPPTILYAVIGVLWTTLQGVAVWMAHGAREAGREASKTIWNHSDRITKLETETGVTTSNGMRGEIKSIREWRHEEVVPKLSRLDLLDFRVSQLEGDQ